MSDARSLPLRHGSQASQSTMSVTAALSAGSQKAEDVTHAVAAHTSAVSTNGVEEPSTKSGQPHSPAETTTSADGQAKPPPSDESEESEDARIERLGRQRPAVFKSWWMEAGFAYSVIGSQVMTEYFVSGFNVLLPGLIESLSIPTASSVWPASAMALTTASFLLPFGRLADMYGGYVVYISGLVWFAVWSLVAGFASRESFLFLVICRALQGMGSAAFLPSGVMLLGSIYRPGPRKNLIFSLYGAAAALGFFIGIFFAGLCGEYLIPAWYFFIGVGLTLTTLPTMIFTTPSDSDERRAMGIKMDWIGSILIVCGLILVVFAFTDASHAPNGWKTPYILVTMIFGSLLLIAAIYVEARVASNPLIPSDLFQIPQLTPLFIALFFSYGVLGVFLLYSTLYMQNIMGATPLQVAAWYTPMSGGGVIISIIGGYILHIFPGTILILVSGLAWCLTSILFAIAPEGANYWAYIFPSMVCATIGIDITFNVANIFISTSLAHSRQGLAGAIINSLLWFGIATCIAFGDVVQTQTAELKDGETEREALKRSYHNVFWYQLACATTALVILLCFVRIKKAKSDLTADEKAERRRLEKDVELRENKGGETALDARNKETA